MKKNFSQMILGLAIIALLTLPLAVVAKDDAPFISPSLIGAEFKSLTQFSDLVVKYEKDCETLKTEAKPDGQRLKQCLTVARELSNKFGSFQQNAESLMSKIKNAGKWTKELDEDFKKNAAKRGAKSDFINFVEQNGGVRNVYQKKLSALSQEKSQWEAEVKTLENSQSKSVSSSGKPSNVLFVTASFARTAPPRAYAFRCKNSTFLTYVSMALGGGIWYTAGDAGANLVCNLIS